MIPYRLFLGLLFTSLYLPMSARPMMSSPAPEGYEIELEVVSEDIGLLVGALGITDMTGYSCTRLYVTMNNADDFMSSVSGDGLNPTYVNTTTDFYHAVLGAGTPNGINSLLFPVYPDLAYDTWITIGIDGAPNAMMGEGNVSTVQATDNPWLTNFDPGGGMPGGDLAIDDLIGGAWYALNGDSNGIAGDDLRVLIGQFTTTGEISGQVYCQVFINGDGSTEFRDTFFFGGTEIEGCLDLDACNYNAEATSANNDLCEYPLDVCAEDFVDCDCNCVNDADADNVCDENEIPGCSDLTACNYSALATDDDGSCTYAEDGYDCDGGCLNDADLDGICDAFEIPGCTEEAACNYSELATDNDSSCEFLSCAGCTDNTACNYDDTATIADGSCEFPEAEYDCAGNCLSDVDEDGVCDALEIAGCTDLGACNYSAEATDNDGSCAFAEDGYDCDGNCLSDGDDDGICDEFDPCADPDLTPIVLPVVPSTYIAEVSLNGQPVIGMTVFATANGETVGVDEAFDFEGNSWVSMTLYVTAGDDVEFQLFDATECELYDLDLTITVTEEGEALSTFDNPGSLPFLGDDAVLGCTDETACNFNTEANVDDASCTYPDAGLDCDGNCLADADSDGICDEDEINGCTDVAACNYDVTATDNDGSCAFPLDLYGSEYVDCDGNCITDENENGLCDEEEVLGCTDAEACNYNMDANTDDASCTYPLASYLDCDGLCLNDEDNDGLCDEIEACSDAEACNYDPSAIEVEADYCLIIDTVAVHTAGDLAGMTTYRYYVKCANGADFLSSVSGDSTNPTSVTTTTSFFQDAIGSATPNAISPVLFPDFPNLQYDSWLTIGLESAPDLSAGEAVVSTIQMAENPWISDFDPGLGNPGGNISINDPIGGSWFALNGDANGVASNHDNNQVLIAQLTTDGAVEGNFYVQVFENGDGSNDLRFNFNIGDACVTPDEDCEYPEDLYGADNLDCDGNCLSDTDSDGVCDEDEVLGCTDISACNYSDLATDEDGSCEFTSCAGCTDLLACNYDDGATIDNGSCTFADAGYDCDGNCLADADEDGVCDPFEVQGCTDVTACNFDENATDEDNSCTYADAGYDCSGNCLADADGDGVCDPFEIEGCTDATACNFDENATDDNGSCVLAEEGYDCDGNCLADTDGDGICDPFDSCNEPNMDVVVLPVIPNTLVANVTLDGMPVFGSTVIATANGLVVGTGITFDFEGASYVNMNIYLEEGQTVDLDLFEPAGCLLYDLDFDLIATEEGGELGTFETPAILPYLSADAVEGCMDETACNYNEEATVPSTCVYPEQFCGADYYDCDCECLSDADGDGICDEAEVPGCYDALACNFNADATDEDNTLCTYAEDLLDCEGNCLADADGDGICDALEVPGCTEEGACNYDANATDDDASCLFPEEGFDCDGNPLDLDDCDPDCISFDPPILDYTLECLEDLEGITCENPTSALNECTGETYDEVACVSTPYTQPYSTGPATTAFGMGPDAAIRVYGLEFEGLAESDYFVESEEGLTFTQYGNGVAILTGHVENNINPNQGFEVFYVFHERVTGAEWADMGRGFKYIYSCENLPFDEWDMYMLKSDQSFLNGTGEFEGSNLRLNHAPSNGYFGFQVGLGANDHNCDFGLGGWFGWEGIVNGVEVNGALGDVIVDLQLDAVTPDPEDPCITNIYTVFDDSCGAINVTQQICRLDETAPLFDDCPADMEISCEDEVPTAAILTATDNCDDEGSPIVAYLGEIVIDQTSSACYTLERTWSATDLFDNVTLCTQLIHVVDDTAPEIDLTLPGDLDVSVSAMCEVDLSTDMTGMAVVDYSDNCAFASGDLTFVDVVTDSISSGCYTVERRWSVTAADSCGNTATETGIQLIHVLDQQAPVITLSETQTEIACDDWSCDIDQLVALGYASWNDNCGIDTAFIDCQPVSGGCVLPVPTWDVAYTVVDACGNTATTHQFIELIDTVAPTIDITCPADITVQLDGDCNGELDPTQSGEVTIVSTDNCDAAPILSYTIEDSEPDYTCADSAGTYVITRTFFAVSTDHCGNTAEASCTQILTVEDVTAPVVTLLECPADMSVALGEDCSADFSTDALGIPSIEAEDGCDTAPATFFDYSDGPISPLCDGSDGSADGSFSFERTYQAWSVDACGNVSDTLSCVQTITALDETAPVFNNFTPYTSVSCELLSDPLDPTQIPLEAFDNCDGELTLSIEAWPLSGACPGSWMRIWTAEDDCGNTTLAEQYVALYDEVAPEITCPSDTLMVMDQDFANDTTTAVLGLATATDNCSDASDIDITYEDTNFMVDCDGDDDLAEGTMTFTRTFTAVDFCDNTASCSQLVTLVDNLGPLVSVENTTVACVDYDPAASYGEFTATDNFDTDVAWSWSEDSVYNQTCVGAFLVDRTWTFVDDCGNETTAQQTLTVFDDVAPVVLAGDMAISLSCEEYGDEIVPENILIDVEDACGSEVTVTFFDTPFSGGCVQPVGMYMRTYTFVDDCGNANMFEQFIELYDETPPVVDMTCPEDVVVSLDASCAADLSVDALGLATVVATDNCGGASPDVELTWVDHDTTISCAGSFSFTRTFTALAIDNCGNETIATCDQSIGAADVTAPTFVEDLPADATAACDNVPAAAVLTATDACDDNTVVAFTEVLSDDDDCANNYTLLRTWTVTDDCGNEAQHEQTVTVVDETAPEWISELPLDTTVSCESVPAPASLEATDNCDGALVITFNEGVAEGDCAQGQTLTRTWSTMDCAGNALSHVQVITVVDTTSPVIEGELSIDIPCTDWGTDTLYASVSDNCDADIALVLLSEAEFSGSCAGSYLLTYVAMDQCGNADTLIQSVNLIDSEAPVFTFVPQDTTLSCDNDFTVGSLGAAEAVDNCTSEVEIAYSDSIVYFNGCNGTADVTRTWTAEDECGNVKTVLQLITLIDETAPEFVEALPGDMTVACDNVPLADILTAIDNCDPEVTLTYSETQDDDDLCPSDYVITRTWSLTDCAGNENSHTQVLTVLDTVAPTFTAGPLDTTVACNAVPSPADIMTLQANDNCDAALSYAYVGEAFEGGSCADGYTLTRTWSATDCSGNSTEWMQTLTVIDTVAPSLDIVLANGSLATDTTVSCLDEVPALEALVLDACDAEPALTMTIDTVGLDGCGNATLIHHFVATDNCGNTASTEVTITVSDEAAPTWLDVCGIENGGTVEVCAEDHLGDALLPSLDACDVSAIDNCGGDVTLDMATTVVGAYAPNDSVDQFCTTVTPEAFNVDETCNGYETHAVRMFNFLGGEFYSTIGEGLVSQLPNGDWLIEETVSDNANPNAGWNVTFTLTDGMDFDSWSNQDFPTSYKQDCETLLDDHENWAYWFLSEGTLTGWGDYEGSLLTCTHQPANQFYRFQIGLGANNMNNHYGYSGWFNYSGTHQSTPVMGSGDFFGDLDCALPYQIEYDYTATDCSGNQAEFGYTVDVTGEICDPNGIGAGLVGTGSAGGVDTEAEAAELAEARGPIQVSHVAPNPTHDYARIGFNVLKQMRLEVEIYNANGAYISTLFTGNVNKDQMYTLDIPAYSLESGVYQVRMTSNEVSIVKQFMVTE